MFYPDETSTAYIMTSIADSLGADLDVHVICGPSGYDELKNKQQSDKPFTIHRINAFNFNKNNVYQRLARLLLISFGMLFQGLFKIRKVDKVLLVTNPAFAIPLFSILKRMKGFSYFILVHDVFPENLLPAKILSSRENIIYKSLKTIYDWSYQQSNQLIVLGRDMKEIMSKKTNGKNNIAIIENWADLEKVNPEDFSQNELILQHGLANKIVFLFAGNLGRLQGLPFLFDIIREVNNDLLHFAFVGDGALYLSLTRRAGKEQLNNVSFWSTFPREQQNLFLNASHFGIVTLDPEVYGLGVPSKSYNILAAGKPIFFIGSKESEIAQMVIKNQCGIVFDKSEKEAIISFMDHLDFKILNRYEETGKQARNLAEKSYSRNAVLEKFRNLLLMSN